MDIEMNAKLLLGMLAIMASTGSAYAADISICPKVSDIKSEPFSDTDPKVAQQDSTDAQGNVIKGAFVGAFKYTAASGGKTWTGEVHGSRDTYLESKYKLKVENFAENNGKYICDYGGEKFEVETGKLDANGKKEVEVSDPNLRLSTSIK